MDGEQRLLTLIPNTRKPKVTQQKLNNNTVMIHIRQMLQTVISVMPGSTRLRYETEQFQYIFCDRHRTLLRYEVRVYSYLT